MVVQNRIQNNTHIVDETSSSDLSSISLYSGSPYIEHPISKFDTLVGIAIKYGVEVSDIKRMNALVTDHQMFALKSLHIPTPGRHPSPHLSEDLDISRKSNCEQNSSRLQSYNLFDSFQSLRTKPSTLKSPLQAVHHTNIPAICEMTTTYRKGEYDDPMLASFPNPPLQIHHRKSRSFANDFPFDNVEFNDIVTSPSPNGVPDATKRGEKRVRRRQKSVADFSTIITSNGECLKMTTKSLDVRLKGAARINNAPNGVTTEVGKLTPVLMDDEGADSVLNANGISGGRRSSSTCSLQDTDKGNSSSSMWSRSTSSWSLKTDLQALSSAMATLPMATTNKFKASMD